MTITSRVDKARRLILSEASGTLTNEDVLKYTEWVRSDPTLAEFDMLMDLSGAERVEVTSDGLRNAALRIPSRDKAQENYRVAIVAQSDFAFGMSRMYEMLRAGAVGEVRVFRDIIEAKKWLGIEGT
jgi:hypothetical protein